MKIYVQSDDNITAPAAPYAVASGGGCLIGALFGVAQSAAAQGAPVVLVTEDCFDLPKKAGDAPTFGALLYWDDANRQLTTTAVGNKLVGCAIAASAGTDATARIRLNGVAS